MSNEVTCTTCNVHVMTEPHRPYCPRYVESREYEEVQVDESKSKLQSLVESQERHIERLESFISTLKEENERLRIEKNTITVASQWIPATSTANPSMMPATGIQTPSQLRASLEEKLRQKALIKKEESVQ